MRRDVTLPYGVGEIITHDWQINKRIQQLTSDADQMLLRLRKD
jgi:hypothetical protein